MRKGPRTYIYMVKIVFKLCRIIRIVTYHYAPHPIIMTAHFIDIDMMIAIYLLTAPLTY
jgi:hypothetical protein